MSIVRVVRDGGWHRGGVAAAWELLRSNAVPELSPDFLATVAHDAVVTVSYATSGMTLALAIGVPGAIMVSGVLPRRRWVRLVTGMVARVLFGATRAIHELVWALLFLIVLGPVPVAGVLAIGLPYGATLARVLGERLQDVPAEPLAALHGTGARPTQLLVYGRVPLAGADAVAYLWYRFECAVRAAAVLSFIGLGGIGYRIDVALADLRFGQVWTLLGALLVLILAVDALSIRMRRRLVA